MTTTTQALPKQYTAAEYLAQEETSEERHEYHDGAIIPMTGGSLIHNRIIGNIFAWLKSAVRGTTAKIYITDLRVWIPETRRYTYPDVFVIQGDPQYHDQRNDTVLNPSLIIEVLSPSTSDYDRGDKFRAYRTIPTFQEYWLVEQSQIQVEQYCKTDDHQWLYRPYNNPETVLQSPTLNLEMTLKDIYEDVDF